MECFVPDFVSFAGDPKWQSKLSSFFKFAAPSDSTPQKRAARSARAQASAGDSLGAASDKRVDKGVPSGREDDLDFASTGFGPGGIGPGDSDSAEVGKKKRKKSRKKKSRTKKTPKHSKKHQPSSSSSSSVGGSASPQAYNHRMIAYYHRAQGRRAEEGP